MTTILKGDKVVDALNSRITKDVEMLKSQGVLPTLAILRVGERPDDVSYERGAMKRAEKVGVAVRNVLLPETVRVEALIAAIESLNTDASVHGVLLFRPLPAHIDEDLVRNTLISDKDIDGITDLSLSGVFTDTSTGFAPCTAAACLEIIDHYDIELKGRRVVVIGRSLVIGKPVAMMLLARHATVTLAHSRTEDLPSVAREADVVIVCVGRAQMVGDGYLKPGQTVIDVGINVTGDGQLVGDVDFAAAETIASVRITPVPGGVGTVTTSVLMKHVVTAAKRALTATK
jgi:methylenetetrahydrofolate dehydrogenase (NADP+)/methenyltetrahydrofolate cyclohydrolase